MNEIAINELDILINNFWISKEVDPDLYYRVKSKIHTFSDFVQNKLGLRIIVTTNIIKLEKIPSVPKSYMGIQEFDEVTDYIILMLCLMFLEDKVKGDQFILSNLTSYITTTSAVMDMKVKIDWNLYRHRKSLVDVLKYITSLGLITVTDGDSSKFADNQANEVLYNTNAISNYMIRNFNGDIFQYKNCEDFIEDEWENANYEDSVKRRYKAYRHLIYCPLLFGNSDISSEFEYIKNYRNTISKDMEMYLESELHIHKNMAFLSLNEERNGKQLFPNSKVITDIVLAFNTEITARVGEQFIVNNDDTVVISDVEFKKIVLELKQKYNNYFSKEYRDYNSDKLARELIDYMESFNMISRDLDNIIIYPIVARINGFYRTDSDEISNNEQIDLGLEV